MDLHFTIPPPFQVPDGTWVSPFLNAKDSQSDLPFDLLDGFSIAAGRIDPGTCSQIHVMPLVSQVTFVRSGKLRVMMQGASDEQPFAIDLNAGEAALTEQGVAFQLISNGAEPCEVLYIVSPAYVFDMSPDGEVRYDDSVMVGEHWSAWAGIAAQLDEDAINEMRFERTAALSRIAERKGMQHMLNP